MKNITFKLLMAVAALLIIHQAAAECERLADTRRKHDCDDACSANSSCKLTIAYEDEDWTIEVRVMCQCGGSPWQKCVADGEEVPKVWYVEGTYDCSWFSCDYGTLLSTTSYSNDSVRKTSTHNDGCNT